MSSLPWMRGWQINRGARTHVHDLHKHLYTYTCTHTPIHIHIHTHTNTHTHTVYINYYYYNKKKQNQTFAHTHLVSHFCHGFNSSLIQIHKDSLHFSIIFTIGSMMSHFFHDVPYIYIYWIRIWDIMLYFLPSCYIITEGYRYIYIYICHPLNNT